MKVSPNNLIVKMIQNSFWFIEKNIVPKPTTSCGLFLAGVVSGLWHVAYTIFAGCLLVGVLFAITLIIGMGDMLYLIGDLPFIIKTFIISGVSITIVGIYILLPLVVVVTVFEWLGKKGAFSKVLPTLDKVYHFAATNWLTWKLSALCKTIDYKDN